MESVKRRRMGNTKSIDKILPIVALNVQSNTSEQQTSKQAQIVRHQKDYQISGFLGSGVYGCVLSATRVCTECAADATGTTSANTCKTCNAGTSHPKDVAVKVFSGCKAIQDYQDIVRDFFGLKLSRNLFGVLYNDHNQVALMMPKYGARLGSSTSIALLSYEFAANIMLAIAHQCKRFPGIHRDIKPSNILLGNKYANECKLIDYGLSTNAKTSNDFNVVTLWYRAPEILLQLEYDSKVDVWSFGLVFLNILTGTILFNNYYKETKSEHGILLMDMLHKFGVPEDWPEFEGAMQRIVPDWSRKSMLCGSEGTFSIAQAILQEQCKKYASSSLCAYSTLGFSLDDSEECMSKLSATEHAMNDAVTDLLRNCLQINPNKRFSWDQVVKHKFWQYAADFEWALCTQHEEKPLSDDLTRYMQFFFSRGPTRLLNQPQDAMFQAKHTSHKQQVLLFQQFLQFAKRIDALLDEPVSKESLAVAYWMYASQSGKSSFDVMRCSQCMFIVLSYNSNLRKCTTLTWKTWNAMFGVACEAESGLLKTLFECVTWNPFAFQWSSYFSMIEQATGIRDAAQLAACCILQHPLEESKPIEKLLRNLETIQILMSGSAV